MKQSSNAATTNHPLSPGKCMLTGAAIGLLLISIFVFGVDEPKPEWGKLWRLRPLVITPLSGLLGGLCFYFMIYMSTTGAINKTLAYIIGVVVFIISLWLGVVMGLDSTMWD